MLGRFFKRRAPKNGGTGPQICMVALAGMEHPAIEAIESAWRELFPRGSLERLEGEDAAPGFVVDGCAVMFVHVPMPIPQGDIDSAVVRSWIWPEAATEMARQRSHIILGTPGGDPVESATAVTRLAAAVCRAADAVGVYWGSGGHVIKPEDMIDGATEEEVPPVWLWVGLVISAESETGPFCLSSCGMTDLGHMELEIIDTTMPAEELVDQTHSIIAYLLENGPVLLHGHTFGPDPDTKFRVEHAKSEFRKRERVLRLHIP